MSKDLENKDLHIKEDYLNELINYVGSSLCGKILKRFEILEDKNAIKVNVKELVYEEFRHFRDLIQAHNRGFDIQQYKCNTSKDSLTQKV